VIAGCVTIKDTIRCWLVLSVIFGITLIVVHAFVLGEIVDYNKNNEIPKHNWLLQQLDLDLLWYEQCGDGKEMECVAAGCTFGTLVTIISLLGLGCSHKGGAFKVLTFFCAVQVLVYVAMTLVKYPMICADRHKMYGSLEKRCVVLSFLYLERAAIGGIIGLWGIMTFISVIRYPSADELVDDEDTDADSTQNLSSKLKESYQSLAQDQNAQNQYPVPHHAQSSSYAASSGGEVEGVRTRGAALPLHRSHQPEMGSPSMYDANPMQSIVSIGSQQVSGHGGLPLYPIQQQFAQYPPQPGYPGYPPSMPLQGAQPNPFATYPPGMLPQQPGAPVPYQQHEFANLQSPTNMMGIPPQQQQFPPGGMSASSFIDDRGSQPAIPDSAGLSPSNTYQSSGPPGVRQPLQAY